MSTHKKKPLFVGKEAKPCFEKRVGYFLTRTVRGLRFFRRRTGRAREGGQSLRIFLQARFFRRLRRFR